MSRAMQPKQPKAPKQPAAPKTQVYVLVNGQQAGPFTKTELTQLVKNGTLCADTMVWEAGLPDWRCAVNVPHVHKLLLLYAPKRKEPETVKSQPAPEHPLRKDLIEAMAQLGYKGAEVIKAVDALLAKQPEIGSSEAMKELIKGL